MEERGESIVQCVLETGHERRRRVQGCKALTGGEGLGQITLELGSLVLVVDNQCVPEESA